MIKRIKSNKLLSLISILIIALFLILAIRVTYSYFAPTINTGVGKTNIQGEKVDKFDLTPGEPLIINATSTTLPENGSNLTVSSTSTISLLANDTNNIAKYYYSIKYEISNNTFIYSDESTPEIILTIINPNGELLTNYIEGLTYGTFNGISGYDVTVYNGTLDITQAYEILSKSSKESTVHEWKFTLTYLNQNIDQSPNYGNAFNSKVIISEEKIEEVNDNR